VSSKPSLESLFDIPEQGVGMFKCRQCGSTDVNSVFIQTRSADEGADTACSCRQCGYSWRVRG
jgi:DNA-directed RNA polymerase subunit M/transcription elongation factor TFIIS